MRVSKRLESWLLDGADPSVRYRVLTELLGRPPRDPAVVRARKEIGKVGWAARMLQEQHPGGQWDTPGSSGRELYRPKYIATNWKLLVLSDLGVSGADPRVAKALALFLRVMGGPKGGFGGKGSEVCFTGNAARMLGKFGRTDEPALRSSLDWLVRHQKKDGGWHCFRSRSGTLDGWEALSAFAVLPLELRTPAIERSIAWGAEFYLDRGLLREGRAPYAPWLRLHFPAHYYYDYLVGLDFLTALGYGDDPRMRPALDRLEKRRNPDGSWDMDALHPDSEDPDYRPPGPMYPMWFEAPGRPSRWITTTALRVLDRAGR